MQNSPAVGDRRERSFDVSAAIGRFAQETLAGSRCVRYRDSCISAKFGDRSLFCSEHCFAKRPDKGCFGSKRFGNMQAEGGGFPKAEKVDSRSTGQEHCQ